jgi:hypothetical protein
VSARYPDSLSVSVCSATGSPAASAAVRQVSIWAGVAPQSSCTLNPPAPASTAASSSPADRVDPRARNAALSGMPAQPAIIARRL